MPTLTPYQKLDEVLKYFNTISRSTNPETLAKMIELFPEFNEQKNGINMEMYRILDKLLYDRNITQIGIGKDALPEYCITFEGALFCEQGGYSKKKEKEDFEFNLRQQEKQSQADLTEALQSYQKWMAIATIIVSFFYVKELLVWLFGLLHSCF